IALELFRVNVLLDRPRINPFPALLNYRRQLDERAFDREAGLFLQLTLCRLERRLAGELTLRYRPHAFVFVFPERSTGVNEKDLEKSVPCPVEQKTRTLFRHTR